MHRALRQKLTYHSSFYEMELQCIRIDVFDLDLITRGFHRTLQRVRLANRGRLLLRTPGPVPFGTYVCSNVESILHELVMFLDFEFLT